MEKHKTKPRYIFLLISLCVILVVFLVYTVSVGGEYLYIEITGSDALDLSEVHVESSDETVLRIESVEQMTHNSFNALVITVKSVNIGDCTVSLRYPSEETNKEDTWQNDFRVMPFGVIYDLTLDSFTGLKLFLPLAVLALVLVIIVLSLSVREKMKNGDFSYSMVALGGIILFFLLNVITIITDPSLWGYYSEFVSTKDLLALIVSSGKRFVTFSEIPVLLLALALAVSNIQLVVKEGFRVQNLLGVVLAVLITAGMLTIRLSNNYNSIESDVLYYVLVMINIGAAFLLSYFECMFLSTMICAIASTRYKAPYGMDYLIILGCAIQKDGTPTPILRGRVERAFDFDTQQYQAVGKHAIFVPSGGQGSDEVISEAESMKRCLMEMGVPEDRILKEDRSVNTYQNMEFSKKVIEQHAGDIDNVYVGFSTTNYHVFRGYTLAEKINMKVKGLSAKTKLYFFPNAFVREFVGLLWEKKWKHLLFITVFFVFLLNLYLTIRY